MLPQAACLASSQGVQTDAGERRFAGKTHVEPLPDGIVEGGKCPAGDARIDDPAGSDARGAGTHLHNEIWLVREGRGESTRNGVARKMVAGDVGICVAGDTHFSSQIPGWASDLLHGVDRQ
jgi:mannose-6-phosphate isomerase-like protein (cupin superfamily)